MLKNSFPGDVLMCTEGKLMLGRGSYSFFYFFLGGGNEYPIGWKHEENFTSMRFFYMINPEKLEKMMKKCWDVLPGKLRWNPKIGGFVYGFSFSNRGIFRFHLSFRGCINSFWQLFWGPVIFTLRDGHQTSVCQKIGDVVRYHRGYCYKPCILVAV